MVDGMGSLFYFSEGRQSVSNAATVVNRVSYTRHMLKECFVYDSVQRDKNPSIPLPAAHALRKLGRDLALARRKRGISTEDMAVSRATLWRMERGDPTVSAGTLATAAFILQLHDRLANLAAPATDALALSLDERRLPKRIRRVKS